MNGRRFGWVAVAALVAGCSMVPNMDHGTSGCSNAVGIGPTDQTTKAAGVPAFAGVVGREPGDAAAVARGQGHTVVFNVQIRGFGECWCVPPPEGTVTDAFWTQHGALMLMVEGVDEGHDADHQPATGWGCP